MAEFNSPSEQGQPGSIQSSPYSNRVTHLFPRLNTPPQTPPSPPTIKPATKDTASSKDTNITRAELATPSETQASASRPILSPSKPLNPPPSAIEATALNLAQIGAEPGEFWLVERDGWDPWPAVICDERIVSQFFKKGRQHRVSSTRSNGTWGKKFTEHGELVGKRTLPALLLALNKCVWVPCHRLLPLDLQMAKRKQNVSGKEQLGLAYQLAAEQKPLRIWENILIVHRRRGGSGGTASGSAEGGSRERLPSFGTGGGSGRGSRSDATFKFPPSFEDGEETKNSKAQFPPTPPRSGRKPLKREFEDSMRSGKASEATFRFPPGFVEAEEAWSSGVMSLPTPSPFGRKAVKRESEDGMSREDMEALYEGPDADEVRERRDRRAKRIKLDSISTPELLPRQGRKALAEVEVVEISD